MENIFFADIKRGAFALFILILPAILLSILLPTTIQKYCLKGSDLWELKKKNVSDSVIDSLKDLRKKEFFFKKNLMNAIEFKISSSDLFKKYEKLIENQISTISNPFIEYFFLGFLALLYGIILLLSKKFFLRLDSRVSQ